MKKENSPQINVSIVPPAEPKTPEEWQTAADAADALLHIQSAEAYGLITGAPTINVGRCEQLIEAAQLKDVTRQWAATGRKTASNGVSTKKKGKK